MNKSLLIIGIILSLGSVGCAGFGLQHNSSLTAQLNQDRGVDSLWLASKQAPAQGVEPSLYAEQQLGALWDTRRQTPEGVAASGAEKSRGADLWNSASVARSWEPKPGGPSQVEVRRFSRARNGLWY